MPATPRLAKIARPARRMGAARLAPLKIVLESSPSADKILVTKPENDAKLFEETYGMVVLDAGPSGITAAISANGSGAGSCRHSAHGLPDDELQERAAGGGQGRQDERLVKGAERYRRDAGQEQRREHRCHGGSRNLSVRGNPVVEVAGPDKGWTVDMAGIGGAASGKIKARKVLVATGSQSIPVQGVT